MKNIFRLLMFVLAFLLTSCQDNNPNSDVLKNIDLNKISKITVSTTMTNPKKDRTLKKAEYEKVLNTLNRISMTKVENDYAKGWQYYFVIQEDWKKTMISFNGDNAYIGDCKFKISGYNPFDFLYLFE